MSVLITGWRSRIAEEFRGSLDVPCRRGDIYAIETDASHYLICNGLLRAKKIEDQTTEERSEGWRANYHAIVDACDVILAANDTARICVIGSESGYRGSYDGVYAWAKAALHHYVKTTRLKPDQQLVAISPGVIGDAGMTTRRHDVERLEKRRKIHPKGRFLTSAEVAEMAAFLLFEAPYCTGCVVRMHGGEVA